MSDFTDAFPIPLLTAASADETTSDAIPIGNCKQHAHTLTIKKDTTAGRVVVEIGPTQNFAGTWDVIFDMNLATDADLATALLAADVSRQISWPGPGTGFVRHRIDAALTGGANHSVTSTMRRIQAGY